MIFFRENFQFSEKIDLTKDEIEHLRSLRLNEVEKEIEYRDGNGNSYFYSFSSKQKTGSLIDKKNFQIQKLNLSIASAIPKSHRLEFLLQKTTELGIDNLYFINFFQSDRKEINLERCKKILLEACIQSKRHTIPEIKIYSSLEKFILEHPNSFYLNPEANEKISEIEDWNLIPIIGPEGGFRKEEVDLMEKNNLKQFKLGETILKIETACIYLTSLKKFHLESPHS